MGFSSFTVLKCCFIFFIFHSVSCRLGGSSSLVLRKREEAQALGSPSHSVLCLGTSAAGPDDSFLWAPHCIMGCQAAPLFFHQMPVAHPARQPKLSPDFAKCFLRGRVTPVESTSREGRRARGAWREGRSLKGCGPHIPVVSQLVIWVSVATSPPQPALHLQVILTLPHFVYFETVNGRKGKKNPLFYVGLPSLAD